MLLYACGYSFVERELGDKLGGARMLLVSIQYNPKTVQLKENASIRPVM